MEPSSSKSSLFIIELMMAILLFAGASTVCLQVFAKSQIISEATEDLNHAVSKATSIAEVLIASSNPQETLETCFPNMEWKPNNTNIYYDHSWHLCPVEKAAYTAKIIPRGMDYSDCQIQIWPVDEGKIIYEFPLQCHHPNQIP